MTRTRKPPTDETRRKISESLKGHAAFGSKEVFSAAGKKSAALRYGNLTPEEHAEQRFWSYVQRGSDEECWIWQAALVWGYGQFRIKKQNIRAHRFAYELLIGPIPEGLTLDHLCRNRACVNPAHLEPVSQYVNWLRGESASAQNKRATHCANGHEFTEANTRLDSRGKRECRTCKPVREGDLGWWNREKTHCPQGHPYDEANTYVDKTGKRACKVCKLAATRAWRARQAASHAS